ncbi:MAG: universal stress protein [Melioribacteraceae bacterium]|nr:universal stress protein [Melioribacteraceae bacterium]
MIFNKIGLAITFSPNGLPLIKTAARIQNLFSSQLCLIHVGERTDDSELQMRNLLEKAEIPDGSYQFVWQNGEPAKAIINAASENGVDLLIAGALEKETVIKYYLGSVARTIMREALCSVLIITNPLSELKSFKKFCVSVEFSSLGESAVKKSYEFAKLEKAEEFVLIKEFEVPGLAITVYDSGSTQETEKSKQQWQLEEEEKLSLFAKELNLKGIKYSNVALFGKQGWEARNFVKNNGSDLFVVPSPPKKLKFFDKIFQHDLEFILSQLPCSLLIIRE